MRSGNWVQTEISIDPYIQGESSPEASVLGAFSMFGIKSGGRDLM